MRKLILFTALAAVTAVAANATTWVATCNDGKNVQYVQTLGGAGYLYLKTAKDYFQIAQLKQTSAADTVVCGAVIGNVVGNAAPLTQVCMNKSRQIITLKYRNPATAAGEGQDAGEFCAAAVTLRATNLKEH
jgi:hypothetical protein